MAAAPPPQPTVHWPWGHLRPLHYDTNKKKSSARLFSSPGPLDKLAMLNLLTDRTKAFSHLWTPSSGRRKATSQKGTRIIATVERVRNLHKLGPKPTLLSTSHFYYGALIERAPCCWLIPEKKRQLLRNYRRQRESKLSENGGKFGNRSYPLSRHKHTQTK